MHVSLQMPKQFVDWPQRFPNTPESHSSLLEILGCAAAAHAAESTHLHPMTTV